MRGEGGPIQPIDVVRAVYASHAERDTGGLLAVLDDDLVWWQAQSHPYANPDGAWHGTAEVVRHVVEPINNDWERFITRVDDMLDAGDRIVVYGAYNGTFKATRRTIAAPVCVIYTVRDSRIVEFRQFVDTAQIRWAMGLTAVL